MLTKMKKKRDGKIDRRDVESAPKLFALLSSDIEPISHSYIKLFDNGKE